MATPTPHRRGREDHEVFSFHSFKNALTDLPSPQDLKEKIQEAAEPVPVSKSEYNHIYKEIEESNPNEKIIWIGRSSQFIHSAAYIMCFLFCWLIFPIFIAWYLNESTKHTIYVLTQERLRVYSGIIIKRIDDLELYRVKDTIYMQSFILRFFGLSNILLITSDVSWGDSSIPGIENGIMIREKIRKLVEAIRVKKGVTEIDYYTRGGPPQSILPKS